MDRIADARDKLDDAYGRLEDVRFNQKNMDTKELREAKRDIDKTANAGLKSLINFAGQELNMDAEEAKTMFGGATHLQAAQIAAAPGIARNKLLEKQMQGDVKKQAEFTKVQSQVTQDLKNDVGYQTAANEAAKNAIYTARLRAAIQNNPFLASYAAGIGFSSKPMGDVHELQTQ